MSRKSPLSSKNLPVHHFTTKISLLFLHTSSFTPQQCIIINERKHSNIKKSSDNHDTHYIFHYEFLSLSYMCAMCAWSSSNYISTYYCNSFFMSSTLAHFSPLFSPEKKRNVFFFVLELECEFLLLLFHDNFDNHPNKRARERTTESSFFRWRWWWWQHTSEK